MPVSLQGRFRRARAFLLAGSAALLLPYAATLALSGHIIDLTETEPSAGGRRVYVDGRQGYVDAEEYLIGVLARQIPMDYEPEALKAQAIAARTWLWRQMDGAGQIAVSASDTEYLTEAGMEELWGEANFVAYYEKARRAVEETAGQVILCDGQLIEPLFHRASAGRTRDGDSAHPYLQSVDSGYDIEAEDYLTVKEWTPEEFEALVNGDRNGDTAESRDNGGIAGGGRLSDTLQLVSQDSAGYVAEYQIGSHVYTGDEVRQMLSLPSSAFTLKKHEENIQAVCRGQGHGLGLSQYGAQHLALEGWSAAEILSYYYHGTAIGSAE